MIDLVGTDDEDSLLDELDRLAIKALGGRSTPEETARLDALCAASPEARERITGLADVWMLSVVAGVKSSRRSLAGRVIRPDRRWITGATAAGLVATIGMALWLGQSTRSIFYAAPSNAVRTVHLSDGSVLTLSRGGRIKVSIDGDGRSVHQLSGEAYYDVTPDASRPFVVTSGAYRLTVLGTRFNVAPDTEGLKVDLLEGRLRIEPEGDERAAVLLSPGQAFRQNRTPTVVASDVEGSAAWTVGKLIFDDVTLSEVASHVRRHTGRTMSFTSPKAETLRFSGVLSVHRPGEWAMALESVLPVKASPCPDGMRIALDDG